MNPRKPILGVAAGMLALGLAAGTGAASAQTANHGHAVTGHAFGAALKGTVQNLGTSSFQVKSSTGTVTTVTYGAQTHVEKIVAGTTADLTANAHISVQLKPGTTTVTAIVIEPAHAKPSSGTTMGTTGTRPVHTHPTKGTTSGTTTGTKKSGKGTKSGATKPTTGTAHAFAAGAVVSLSGNSLKLSGHGGTTTTYTLAPNVTITKVVVGTSQDLANNETVQVFASASGAAREITILAA